MNRGAGNRGISLRSPPPPLSITYTIYLHTAACLEIVLSNTRLAFFANRPQDASVINVRPLGPQFLNTINFQQ